MAVANWVDPVCRCSARDVPADVVGGYWHTWGCPIRTFNLVRAALFANLTTMASATTSIVMNRDLRDWGSAAAILALLMLAVLPLWLLAAFSWHRRVQFPSTSGPF